MSTARSATPDDIDTSMRKCIRSDRRIPRPSESQHRFGATSILGRRPAGLRASLVVPDDPGSEMPASIRLCLTIVLLVLVAACGFGGQTPAPTAVVPPTPAPRPTAE